MTCPKCHAWFPHNHTHCIHDLEPLQIDEPDTELKRRKCSSCGVTYMRPDREGICGECKIKHGRPHGIRKKI